MKLGLSIEIDVPADVCRDALTRIGQAFAPDGMDTADLNPEDAVEYGFSDPDGIAALNSLGVTWSAIRTGTITEPLPREGHP